MVRKLTESILDFGQGTKGDHMGAFAAQSAFFILLSFFPIANILLMLTRFLPFTRSQLIAFLANIVPKEFETFLVNIINDIYFNSTNSVTIISVVIALWSASKGIMAIRNGLNEVYDAREKRNYFVTRAISAVYTGVFIVMIIVIIVLNMFGNQIANWVIRRFPNYENITTLIIGLRSVGSFLLMFLVFWCMYTAMPNKKLKFMKQLPGAIFGSLAWVALTRLFSWYIVSYGSRSSMYGSLTTIILIMFWLYFGVYVIFIGGQINQYLLETDNLKNVLQKSEA